MTLADRHGSMAFFLTAVLSMVLCDLPAVPDPGRGNCQVNLQEATEPCSHPIGSGRCGLVETADEEDDSSQDFSFEANAFDPSSPPLTDSSGQKIPGFPAPVPGLAIVRIAPKQGPPASVH